MSQFQGGWQPVYVIGIDHGAIRHAQTQQGCLELAQLQGLQVERHSLDTPGVYQGQMGKTVIDPGFPACLLLKLLRGQQSPRDPQGAVYFHGVIPSEVT
ncbi:hypothetical protein D3C81_1306620 [compost metagenome]